MGKKTDNKSEVRRGRERICKVSYTLNNDQPVRSTIIGDQPLFYMDYDGSYDDEDGDSLLEGIETQAAPMTGRSTGIMASAQERVAEFFSAAFDITERAAKDSAFTEESLLEILSRSRFAKALIEEAVSSGVTIQFCDQTELASYARPDRRILLNRHLGEAETILLTVRELRRAWQHSHGVLVNPLTFYPDQAILVNRAQVADLTVSMVRTAWELQLSGEKGPWERMELSPMADIARVFAREAFMDFRTLNNGTAMAASFEAWFLSERCRKQDKVLIQNMLADYQGYVFGSEQASKAVTADLITALGSLPFGRNYLSSYAAMVINDPVFTEVRDRSNANFLWFIKFEKSFREAEQELQQGTGTPCQGIAPGIPVNLRKDTAHEKTADVVALDAFLHAQSGAPPSAGTQAGGAQIVRFPRSDQRT